MRYILYIKNEEKVEIVKFIWGLHLNKNIYFLKQVHFLSSTNIQFD